MIPYRIAECFGNIKIGERSFHVCGTLKAQLFRSCLFCGRYGEVIWEVEDTFYWPLPLPRGGRCRAVKIRANVWIFRRDNKKWPLQRGGRCREVAVVGRWPLVEVRLYVKGYAAFKGFTKRKFKSCLNFPTLAWLTWCPPLSLGQSA